MKTPAYILLLALGVQTLCAQQAVLIHEESALSIGPCEPSIAIDPTNPARMVAGSVPDNVYWSADSGKTWSAARLKSSHGVWGDPVLVADTNGRFYYFHLSDPDGTRWESEKILDRIVCQWSDDGGKTWSDGSYMGLNHPKQQDKEWAVVDLKSNHVYVAWTQFDVYGSEDPEHFSNIMFARSEDGGESWSKALRINEFSGDCRDGSNTTEGAVPAVGPFGEVYVAWAWNERIYFDRTLDGGQTWLDQDLVVSDQPGGWSTRVPGLGRSNGMPITATGLSRGENRGNIYVCWADTRNGMENMDIFLAVSGDQGSTWSEPIRVNQDQSERFQFFPWLSVDPETGSLYVVYYDRRAHAGNKTDVYLAVSHDAGASWTEQKLNRDSFTPVPGIFFGDYNHIAVHNGIIRPVWTEYREGKLQIWTSLLE